MLSNMATESVYVRLDDEAIARLDALATEMSAAAKGARITRSAALRVLVDRGFASLDVEKSKKR